MCVVNGSHFWACPGLSECRRRLTPALPPSASTSTGSPLSRLSCVLRPGRRRRTAVGAGRRPLTTRAAGPFCPDWPGRRYQPGLWCTAIGLIDPSVWDQEADVTDRAAPCARYLITLQPVGQVPGEKQIPDAVLVLTLECL